VKENMVDMQNTNQSIPITVVCATKLTKDQFILSSQTGKSLFSLRNTSPVQVRLFEENSIGLSELYNLVIEEAKESPSLLIFMHDDVLINDFFWTQRIYDGLKNFDIVGVVGNTRRSNGQPGWIMTNLNGTLDDFKYLSGAIGQGSKFPPEKLDVFGPSGLECKLMDGVFLAAYSETLHASGLRFDPAYKFHFYDIDFCRSAEMLNLKMGTIPLSIVHASYGGLDQAWLDAYQRYLKKWGG
jgi:hypothetical protein